MTTHTMEGLSPVGLSVVLKVIGTLFALYLVNDAWTERELHQTQTPHLEHELADVHQKILNHDRLVTQLQEMRALLSSLTERLPSKLASPTIEKALRDRAAEANITIARLHLDEERVMEGFYTERGVSLVAEGSTADFVRFMDGMLRDSPLRRVTDMKIEPADSPGRVRATMTSYYYHAVDE